MSSILFLIGLLLCQNSGEYWLQLFDSYSLNLALLWIALFHLIGMNFVYGTERYLVFITNFINICLGILDRNVATMRAIRSLTISSHIFIGSEMTWNT